MRRRSGVTLLEVLVAIFIMGIGLLALLTLFPIGILRMAKAIQDDKCASAGYNAASIGAMKSLAQDLSLFNPNDPFQNPYNPKQPLINDANPDGPSYPVLVDPIGWRASVFGTPAQLLVGGTGSYLSRRSVSFVNNTTAAFQWFTDLNDIDWETGPANTANSQPGTPRLLLPVPPNAAVFSRDIRYSWAYLMQRPRYADATVGDTQIIVYNKRSVALTGTLTLREYIYSTVAIDFNKNTFTVDYSALGTVPPPVRVGDWVLDNTPIATTVNATNYGSAHGRFYRIVSANDLGNDLLELEVEQPIPRLSFVGAPQDKSGNWLATLLVLDGVAEVYAKGVTR